MIKKIFSYAFVEGFSKGLNKLVVLLLPIFLSNVEFGIVGLIIALELFLPLISLLGFERAVLRFYSYSKTKDKFINTIFTSITVIHLFLIILGIGFFISGQFEIFGIKIFPDLAVLLAIVYFQGTNLIFFNVLRVNSEHKLYFKYKLAFQLLKLSLVILLTLFLNNSLGYLLGALIASFIIYVLLIRNQVKFEFSFFDKKIFNQILLFSWPFIFHGISGNLLGNVDRFIIKEYFTLEEVSYITFVNTFGSSILFAFIGVSVYLEPMIYKEKNECKRETLLDKYLFITLVFGLLIFIFLKLISSLFLPSLYLSYENVLYLIPIVASGYLTYPYYLKSIYKLIYLKKSFLIALVSTVVGLIGLVLNFILTPRYGIEGAVTANIIGLSLLALLFSFFSGISKDLIEILLISFIIIFAFKFFWIVVLSLFSVIIFKYFRLKIKLI